MKTVITDETVARAHQAGRLRLHAPPSTTVVTPSAYTRARELGVDIVRSEEKAAPPKNAATLKVRSVTAQTTSAKRSRFKEKGSAKREVDASGVIVVRGGSVVLGSFADAGAGRDVGLFDVVTSADKSSMAAGFMSFSRDDSFPWSLGYEEIDYVVEGVLRIEIQGRTIEARAGDVVRIPKGSDIVFATPSRVKVFYVTWPADWAQNAARPQK